MSPASTAQRTVVISQPMFFPWVGMFEQIRLADVYVHYDDVQFSKGSFTNRVQIKGPKGSHWLTVPLENLKLGQAIREVALDSRQDWRSRHLAVLRQFYDAAPFREDMLTLVEGVYAQPQTHLGALAISTLEAVCRYFSLTDPSRFIYADSLGVGGSGSERVLKIVEVLRGTRYVSGHGGRNYLDHPGFQSAGISVEYMDYRRSPYPQLHGPFDPHVSILDLIANCGRDGVRHLCSEALPWAPESAGGA